MTRVRSLVLLCIVVPILSATMVLFVIHSPALAIWSGLIVIAAGFAGVAVATRGRDGSPGPASISALVLFLVMAVLSWGYFPHKYQLFGRSPTSTDYLLPILGGALALLMVFLLSRTERREEWNLDRPWGDALPSRNRMAIRRSLSVACLTCVLVASINFATSTIPVLADNVNEARFAGYYGVLQVLWTPVQSTLQFLMALGLTVGGSRRLVPPWAVVASGLILLATGARAFVVLVVLTWAFMLLASRRVGLRTLAALAFATVGFVAIAGAFRLGAGSEYARSVAYLAGRGITGPLALFETSIRTGPQVAIASFDAVNARGFLNGTFILRDALQALRLADGGSDRLVTVMIGRDPSLVGGMPPTIFGGFYLDSGWVGVAVGSILTAALLFSAWFWAYRNRLWGSLVFASYFSAYVAISSYSYISVRPSVIFVLALSLGLNTLQRRRSATIDQRSPIGGLVA